MRSVDVTTLVSVTLGEWIGFRKTALPIFKRELGLSLRRRLCLWLVADDVWKIASSAPKARRKVPEASRALALAVRRAPGPMMIKGRPFDRVTGTSSGRRHEMRVVVRDQGGFGSR